MSLNFPRHLVLTLLAKLSSLPVRNQPAFGGAKRDRTADLLRARQALSQLSYGPIFAASRLTTGSASELAAAAVNLVGLGGFEPPTSPLSGVRSNQLSYRP